MADSGYRHDGARDRPFHGSIDNARFYSKVPDETALEQIRQADVKNEIPPAF